MKRIGLSLIVLFALFLVFACFNSFLLTQQTYELAPYTNAQFTSSTGVPLASGSVCTYASGTTTPLVTYSNATGTANLACLSLDSSGRASIYLTSAAYKFIVKNSAGVTIRTIDPVQVAGLNAISNFNHTTNVVPKFGGSSTLAVSQISDSGSKVNIGATNSITDSTLVVAKDGTARMSLSQASSDFEAPTLNLYKARGTHLAPSNVAASDFLFDLSAYAYSGSTYFRTGSIQIDVPGAFVSGQAPPSRMILYTNQANGVATPRLTINPAGDSTFASQLTVTGALVGSSTATIASTLTNTAGGIVVGAPTGGAKGTGTLNIASDIYKNNTAYTNPDYVFERYYSGSIVKFKSNPGAAAYKGLMPLSEVEAYTKRTFQLPHVGATHGIFERADSILQTTEELYLHLFELNRKIDTLESRILKLEAQLHQ